MTLGGFIASNLLVETFWHRYKSNPTRLSVESSHIPLNVLYMPAITICQVNRVDLKRVSVFIDTLYVFELLVYILLTLTNFLVHYQQIQQKKWF